MNTLNFKDLFKKQAELDKYIEVKHPVNPNEDRFSMKVLALMIELGEMANELPKVFKYWSNKENKMKEALEEYIDCLHFLLSIGNDIGSNYNYFAKQPVVKVNAQSINHLITNVVRMYQSSDNRLPFYEFTMDAFLSLGQALGFTADDVLNAYNKKYEENKKRQDRDY